MALKHHTTLKAWPDYFSAIHEHMAHAGGIQPSQDIEDGGLPATGMPDDANELTLVQRERHIGKDRLGGHKSLAQFFNFEKSVHQQQSELVLFHISHRFLQLTKHHVQQHAHNADDQNGKDHIGE